MDKLNELKKKIEEIQTKSLVASDMKQFITLVLSVVTKHKNELAQLSAENIKVIRDSIAYIEEQNSKLKSDVSQETTSVKKDFISKIDEIKSLIAKVKTLKPRDGIDGTNPDPSEVVPLVLEKLPKPFILKRLEVVQEINKGEKKDLKIELKQIDGTDKLKQDISDWALGVLDQRTQFLINKQSSSTYTLPTASDTVLGGVKIGARLTMTGDTLSADEQAGTTDEKVKYDASDPTAGYVADKFAVGAGLSMGEGTGADENKLKFVNTAPDQTVALTAGTNITSVTGTYPNFTINADTQGGSYTLPTATDTVLGGVKVGATLGIVAGVLNYTNPNPTPYTLPTAAAATLGGIKVGTRLSIDGSGVLSADVQTTDISGKQDSNAVLTELTALTDPNADRVVIWNNTTNNFEFLDYANWNTAYGWGNHANAGYLTSVTAHNLLSTTHGDTTADTVVRGDIITGQGATPKWARLAFPATPTGKVLIASATDIGWSASALGTAAYTASTAYDAAGAAAAITPTTLGLVIGTNVQAYNANLTAINQALTTTSSPSFTAVGATTFTGALTGHASSDALVGQTFYIGTTQVAINRASAALTLAGLTLTTPELGAATGTSLDLGTTTKLESRLLTVDTGGVFNVAIGSAAGDDFTVDTNKLVVEGDTGNVGIGTTGPTNKLSVADTNIPDTTPDSGNLYVYTTDAQTANFGGKLMFGGTYNGTTRYGNAAISGRNSSGTAGVVNGYLSFVTHNNSTGDAERMRIDSSGNVGIGTTSPQTKLALSTLSAISFEASAGVTDIALTHTADTLTLSGGNLALGANNLTMTGSLAATGARVTKGWFTDIESTNMPTVGGTSLSSTFAPLASPTFTGTVTIPTAILNGQVNLDGTPAADHTAVGNVTNTFASGYSSTAMDLVFMGSGGKWLEVDSDAVATCNGLIGIALEAKTDTQAMLVALPGSFVRDDTWAWTPGATLYAGETLGAIQATIPTGADAIIKVIGFAVTADVIFFNPSPDQQSTVA